MSNITIYHIKGLIDLKDAEVFAYFKTCRNQLGDNKLSVIQTLTTSYAQTKAQSFLAKYKEFFLDKNNRTTVFRFLSERSSNRAYSGNRFSEEFYKLLRTFANECDSQPEQEKETTK